MSVSPDRAATILARFNAAQSLLTNKLRDLPPRTAEQSPDIDAWSAAQIGWHVAKTNEWMAAILTGSTPAAEPAPPNFAETFHMKVIPDKLTTPPSLEPPAVVGRDSALERLRASGQHMSKAIAALSPQRGTGFVVTLPFGTLSLYELADFAAAHVARHVGQLERAAKYS